MKRGHAGRLRKLTLGEREARAQRNERRDRAGKLAARKKPT